MGFLNGNGKVHRNEEIWLPELAGRGGIVDGHRFEDCHVMGPAVIVVQGDFSLVENEIEGEPDAFLWDISPGRERVFGAILVKDCTFEGCDFTNVGIAGPPEVIVRIRESLEEHAVT
jgi:hypothetical protein